MMKTIKHRLPKTVAVATVVLVAFTVLCRLFWLQPFRDIARCMEPTVKAGDLLIVNRLSYWTRAPERGDVVFVDATKLPLEQAHQARWWIKRVVGVPGDRVSIHPPYVYINDEPLTSPEIFVAISEHKEGYVLPNEIEYPTALFKEETDEILLAENEYFLIGDNTTNSLDSRYFGSVPRTVILGKIIYIISPGSRRGIVK
jgi:signal peptidase I